MKLRLNRRGFLTAAAAAAASQALPWNLAFGQEVPAAGGTVTVAWNRLPPMLDPVGTTSYATRDIMGKNVFESLVQLDATYTPRPVLASKFAVSDNNTKFIFDLRTDVVFHNGEPMTAADVVASVDRWMKDSVLGQRFFVGATAAESGPNQVTITTSKPLAIGATLLADPQQLVAIMPKAVVDQKTADTGVQEFIGTGPYKLGAWQSDQLFLQLDRNDAYVSPAGEASGLAGEKKAYLDSIAFSFVTDGSTRLAGLQSGQYDVARPLINDNTAVLAGDPGLQGITESGVFLSIVFNKKEGPASDVNFRKAVQVALDNEAVMIAAYGAPDYLELDGGLSPVGSAAYTTAGLDQYNQKNVELAKDYLSKSSYKGEPVRYLCTREDPGNYESAVEVQQQLAKIGINVDVQVFDSAAWFAKRGDSTAMDMFTAGLNMASSPILYTFFQPSYAGWTDDPAITAALQAVLDSSDDAALAAAYGNLQQTVYDLVPFIKLANFKELMGARAEIKGIRELNGPILYGMYRAS